jgi:hypothetical protein
LRLGPSFEAPLFDRGVMRVPALSVSRFREFMERSVDPIQKLIEAYTNNPDRLRKLRAEFEALTEPSFWNNIIHEEYLLTRAKTR